MKISLKPTFFVALPPSFTLFLLLLLLLPLPLALQSLPPHERTRTRKQHGIDGAAQATKTPKFKPMTLLVPNRMVRDAWTRLCKGQPGIGYPSRRSGGASAKVVEARACRRW